MYVGYGSMNAEMSRKAKDKIEILKNLSHEFHILAKCWARKMKSVGLEKKKLGPTGQVK